jgi:hypothetical protein
MAKGVNPLIYRLGFFRNWDSLFTESLHVRNYNYFLKTQMINFYIDGFFKKWAWNGRRSYFLNIIYSHAEISWGYQHLNIIIYLYNTGSEIILYRFLKETKNFVLKKQIFDKFNKHIYINKIHILYLKNIFFNSNYKNFHFKKKNNIFKLNQNLKKFFIKTSFINRNAFKKKHTWINLFFFKKNKKIKLYTLILYLYFKKLLKLKLFKTFINFFNFYYFINPLTILFKRYFLKDFYNVLGLKNLNNYNSDISINFVRLNSNSITASTFVKHIWLKLHKKYAFGKVIQGIVKTIKNGKYFLGANINCNGRFTKKQKAWHKIFRQGKIPMSTQSALLDSSSVLVKLRYGVASIKLNINYV